jgi:hypothetical protein
MARLLNEYYVSRGKLEGDGRWCKERINETSFTWPFIQKQMLSIVEETLGVKDKEPVFKGFGTPARIG